MLSDKTASYRARLNKSENNKKSQMKIMKKTHEVFVEEKNKLIAELQEILAEHESNLAVQEGKGRKKGKGTKGSALPGINRLVENINQLHEEKAKLTESMLVAQSQMEAAKEEAMDNASKYRNQISDLQSENKRLKSLNHQVYNYARCLITRSILRISLINIGKKIAYIQVLTACYAG